MFKFDCPREAEAVRAVLSGDSPAACDPNLASHVANCRHCTTAVELAVAFRKERETGSLEAQVTPPGLVWWKAELRARQQAGMAASQPILLAHAVALVSLLAAALIMAARLFGPVRTAVDRILAWFPLPAWPPLELSVFMQPGIFLVCAVALVLAPVAIYLALARD